MNSRILLLLLLGLVAFAAVTPVTRADDEGVGIDDDADVDGEEDAEEDDEEDYLDDDDVDEHPLTDMPLPSPEVLTAGVFPMEDMENPKFAIGEYIETLVGIVNNGQEAINVTMIMGSLNSPFDFNYFIQNFSGYNYNMIVQEQEEYSFHYRFQTAINLDPVDYQVALTVFYENDDELFSHTFFNESVAFYEKGALIDFEYYFKVVGSLAMAVLVVLMFSSIAAGSKPAQAASSSGSNGNTAYNDEWVSAAAAEGQASSGRKYANKGKGKRRSSKKKR